MRTLRLTLWLAGAALGVAAEWVYFGWSEPGDWLPDITVGWTLIACGLVAWSGRPASRSGPLMAATGFAWFAANFSTQALYLHRGPLVHLVLAFPDGRLRGRPERAAVGLAYVIAVIPSAWRSQAVTVAACSLFGLVAGHRYARAVGRDRRMRLAAFQATGFVAAVLTTTAAVRVALPTQEAQDGTLLAYEAALCLLAIALLTALVREPWARTDITDLVVELGEVRAGTLRDQLARALGDPSLEVGYWLPASRSYVDTAGNPLDLSSPGPGRRLTPIELEGRRVAALVHDSAVLDDPELLDAVSRAARLAAANARLQAEVRSQVLELRASRLRLVQAGDQERRRLEQRLHDSVERRLESLAVTLARSHHRAGTASEAAERVRRAEEHLALTLIELRELAAGLHPRVLGELGLAGALAALAERNPVPVDVVACDARLPEEIEAAAYFVCLEALANVAKYAAASHAAVSVLARNGRLYVEVVDDGRGGAVVSGGTGLRGLADRVEALGGTLRLESPPGAGTRLAVDLPIGDEAG